MAFLFVDCVGAGGLNASPLGMALRAAKFEVIPARRSIQSNVGYESERSRRGGHRGDIAGKQNVHFFVPSRENDFLRRVW
jgi:hypothetical protein